ncbi:flagellar hook-associated protein FlgL [Gracilibacillus kekensis]|uniref:Flagellar hook-associated protein 3 FlgL n=1 Tax=Gracilibacillus kekensis TaxID=1027249 RepID=A0A1M7MZZ1_9BACI|nr:flagellar hook-associated protein FlgL [Gracilibacillus kekensis]SHM96761.1 flagellar hook-associated protein 3 FlgL [Gracilibacillus kekensis]
MRVTQGMLSHNSLRNLSNSYQSLGKYMDQLSTGKKINRPSDDPVVAMKGMNYRSMVSNVEQYERNLGEVHNWMDNSDNALDKANDVLERLREIAVQGANGTYEEEQRENMAEEVDQLRSHLEDLANSKVNNKYLFNGAGTTGVENATGDYEPPYEIAADGSNNNAPNNNDPVRIEVSDGNKVQVNVNPSEFFDTSIFTDITNFSNELKNGTDDEAIGDYIGVIDTHIDNNVNARADLGARQSRVELVENRLTQQQVTAKDMMSKNEDADIEEVIMNLTSQESIHRAALSAGARIIQPSLLDFLR